MSLYDIGESFSNQVFGFQYLNYTTASKLPLLWSCFYAFCLYLKMCCDGFMQEVFAIYNVMYMPHGPTDISFTQVWASCQSLGGGCRTEWERSARWKGAVDEGCGYKTGGVLGSESRVLHAHREVRCETCQGKPLTPCSFFPSCFC